MRKNKLLLLLVLLMTAATGAWADETPLLTIESTDYTSFRSGSMTFDDKVTVTFSNPVTNTGNTRGWYANPTASLLTVTGTNGYTITSCKFYAETGAAMTGYTVEGESPSVYLLAKKVFTDANQSVEIGQRGIMKIEVFGGVATTGYTVSLKDGVKDADKWTVKVGEGQAQALPIGGLKGDGSETVTLQYTGRLKVKGVKATSEAAAPSVTEVTTFSELQTALSAGKDVKLMNDIVCTAEISITSGALTIDGNGKQLSTTSEIRAFKVGASATVAFKDLTLTGFVSGGGPAINNSGTIVLDGCTISNCHVNNSDAGGAIENKSSGKLYAINTTFSGNYSGEIGGAINNYRGSLYMSGCTFTDNCTTENDAYYGGAIGINGGDEVRLINCTFSGNQYGMDTGTNDIGVYSKPTNYTIAGCTGVSIASRNGDITTIATGNATLDYSDLSNISFIVEQADPLAVPMTIEAITAGSITVSNPQAGMQYSLNGGAKTPVTTSIEVAAGDKVQFYGNGTSITSYLGTVITGSGNGFTCKVYGNIMSLVDEENFATATTLSGENAFDLLFFNNTTLTDASGLLLPATQLASSCYYSMFQGCSALTAAPELPATQLAHSCYYSMFQGCSALTAAPELPATQLAISCYYSMFRGCSALTAAPELPATQLATYCYREMFYNCTALTASPVLPATQLVSRCYQEMFYKCSKLATVTCLATSGIGPSNSTTNWLQNAGGQAQGTKTFNAVSTANWSTGNNGIPTGWERVNVDN